MPCVCSNLQGTGGRRLYVTVEPALLLKGDIMVSSRGKDMTNMASNVVFQGKGVNMNPLSSKDMKGPLF